eukprot:g6309.t1
MEAVYSGYSVSDSGDTLVVRQSSLVDHPGLLLGHVVASPYLSTAQLHLMYVMEVFSLPYQVCSPRDQVCSAPDKVSIMLTSVADIKILWDTNRITGAFVWNPVKDHMLGTGGFGLVGAGTLGRWGRTNYVYFVASVAFAAAHRNMLDHIVRVFGVLLESFQTSPDSWGVNSTRLWEASGALNRHDRSPGSRTDPAWWRGSAAVVLNQWALTPYNSLDEMVRCPFLADADTQPCSPPTGGSAIMTHLTSQFLYDNKALKQFPDAAQTQATFIRGEYARRARLAATPMTIESLEANKSPVPLEATALSSGALAASPPGTPCATGTVITGSSTGTFGDGHAPGFPYLPSMSCDWTIHPVAAASGGTGIVELTLSLFSSEI